MKINKVKLYNFSSYEGNNEFDFEVTDKKKNIILLACRVMGFVPIFLILDMNPVIHIRILLWIFLYPYLPPHSSGKM